MNKIALLSFLCFGVGFKTLSQSYVATWGSAGKTESPETKQIKIDYSGKENTSYILSIPNNSAAVEKNMFLQEYSSEKGLVKSTTLEESFGSISDNVNFESHLVGTDKLLLFYRTWNKESKTVSYKLRTCSFDGEYKKTDLLLTSFAAPNQLFMGNQYFSISPDKSKYALLVDPLFEKKENDKFTILIFDAQTNKQIKEIQVENTIIAKRSISEMLLDNNGDCFIKRNYTVGSTYEYHLLKINGTDGKLTSTRIQSEFERDYMNESKLIWNNDAVYFVGVYSKSFSDEINGSFISKLNKATGKVESTKFHPFGYQAAFDLKPIKNLELVDVKISSTKLIELIGEVRSKESTGVGETFETKQYRNTFGNITIVAINSSDLSLNWEATVNKTQSFITIGYQKVNNASFSSCMLNDRLFVFYNNFATPSSWKTPTGENQHSQDFVNTYKAPFLYIVEKNGSITYGDQQFGLPLFKLYETAGLNLSIVTDMATANNGSILLLGSSNDKAYLSLGKVTFGK